MKIFLQKLIFAILVWFISVIIIGVLNNTFNIDKRNGFSFLILFSIGNGLVLGFFYEIYKSLPK